MIAVIIYNLVDTIVFDIWSFFIIKQNLFSLKAWIIYETTSYCAYDILAMINTLSFMMIFYQFYTTSEKIAKALGLEHL